MSGPSPYQATSPYVNQVQALPGARYRAWCIAWYVVWLVVSAVFGHYLLASWWQGVLIGLVTGLPLLLRFRQPAWIGVTAATATEPAMIVGGYTAAANWSTPLTNVVAVRVGRSATTEQVQLVVGDREAVQVYNRKGHSRGSLRENEARTGAAIEMDFLGAAAAEVIGGWLNAPASSAP